MFSNKELSIVTKSDKTTHGDNKRIKPYSEGNGAFLLLISFVTFYF